MADEADVGNEAAEAIRVSKEHEIRERARVLEVNPVGHCLSSGCGAELPVIDPYWCSDACRDASMQANPNFIPQDTGVCNNPACGNKIPISPRWCNALCREDWELENKRSR